MIHTLLLIYAYYNAHVHIRIFKLRIIFKNPIMFFYFKYPVTIIIIIIPYKNVV